MEFIHLRLGRRASLSQPARNSSRLTIFTSPLLIVTFTMNAVDKHSAPYTPLCNATADRSIIYNNPPRKRPRESSPSFLGEDVSSLLQQQTLEVDRLILNHTEKVKAELLDCRRRFWQQTLAAVEDGVSKRLRAKDEEIERIRKLNSALQERVRGLYGENQIWRELAQSNEAAVVVLRNDLNQVLAAQVCVNEYGESSSCWDKIEDDA